MRLKIKIFIFILFFVLNLHSKQKNELGFNIYGLSYHFDRKSIEGESFNEFNPGIGINYVYKLSNRNALFFESGFYNDSFQNIAKYFSIGYKFDLIKDRLLIGIPLTLYNSASIDERKWIFAPLPILSVRYKMLVINSVYLPAYDDVNIYPALGLYLTIYNHR